MYIFNINTKKGYLLFKFLFDFLDLIKIVLFGWTAKPNFKNIKHICHEFAFKCNIRIDYVQTLSFDMTFWVKVYVAEQSKNNEEGFWSLYLYNEYRCIDLQNNTCVWENWQNEKKTFSYKLLQIH